MKIVTHWPARLGGFASRNNVKLSRFLPPLDWFPRRPGYFTPDSGGLFSAAPNQCSSLSIYRGAQWPTQSPPSTGSPVRLITSFCWHQIESCVYTVSELLFWCQQKIQVIKVTGHPVFFVSFLHYTYCGRRINNARGQKEMRPQWTRASRVSDAYRISVGRIWNEDCLSN